MFMTVANSCSQVLNTKVAVSRVTDVVSDCPAEGKNTPNTLVSVLTESVHDSCSEYERGSTRDTLLYVRTLLAPTLNTAGEPAPDRIEHV